MRNTRKTTLAKCLLVMLIGMALTSCAKNNPRPTEEAEEEKPNTLKIGTLSQSVSYYEEDNETMGYEYEISNAFANWMDKEPEYVIAKDVNEMVKMLEDKKIDLIAYPLTVSNDLKKKVIYTDNTYETMQVLVQQSAPKQKNKKKKKSSNHGVKELRDVTQLIGKELWVKKNSKYMDRIKNLNNEIGGGIEIKECDDDEETLIEKVSKGEIKYTICDLNIAMANNTNYTNIDINMPVSFVQRAAWAVADTTLNNKVSNWIEADSTKKKIASTYAKYFKSKHFLMPMQRTKRKTYKIPEGPHIISVYDPYFRKEAANINWDWCWIAAIAHQESKFNANAVSWRGARGLMQLMPRTGIKLGAKNTEELMDPEISTRLAARYLSKMCKSFTEVKDMDQKVKFVLGSYNAGVGHIKDAQALAKKHGKDPNIWDDNVDIYVKLKSNSEYFNDPVCKHGYLRGNGVCQFVREISEFKDKYRAKVDAIEGKKHQHTTETTNTESEHKE